PSRVVTIEDCRLCGIDVVRQNELKVARGMRQANRFRVSLGIACEGVLNRDFGEREGTSRRTRVAGEPSNTEKPCATIGHPRVVEAGKGDDRVREVALRPEI